VSHTDDLLAAKRVTDPAAVIERIVPGTELIVPIANGEPVVLLDTIEAHAERLEGVTVHHPGGLKRHEVIGRDRRGDLIALDRRDVQLESSHGHGVAANAAAKVGHARQPRRRKAASVHRRHPKPGGLFESRSSEEHARGERTKLFGRPAAQPVLREHRGNAGGRMPLLAQARYEGEYVADVRARL
jgi:hypothetical protein